MQLMSKKYGDLSWQQQLSLKLKLKPSLSKEEYLKPVAVGLIKTGYVNLTKELSHDLAIVRDDVIMFKTISDACWCWNVRFGSEVISYL